MLFKFLWTGLSLLLLISVPVEQALAGQENKAVADLTALKQEFKQEIERIDDPEEMKAAAAYFAGRAWEIAARSLSQNSKWEGAKEYLDRIDPPRFEMKNLYLDPIHYQVLGLKLFYQSITAVTAILTFEQGDKPAFEDIWVIERQMKKTLDSEEEGMEVVVSLTGGAFSMLALTVRVVDMERKFQDEVAWELDRRLEETASIRADTTGDRFSRLFLWAGNNIDGCFRLVYLLNLALDERLEPAVGPIRRSWAEQDRDDYIRMNKTVLSLIALAEVSFPAAMAVGSLQF